MTTAEGASQARRRVNVMLAIDGLGIGGAEVVLRDLAHTLDPERFGFCICCIKGLGGAIGEQLVREGYDVVVLKGDEDRKADYFTFFKLRRAVRDRRIDVIHTHTTTALLDAAACRLLVPGLKVVHTFHFGNYPHRPGRVLWMEGLGARLANRLVAVGHEQRSRIRAVFRLSASRVGVVWNGVTRSEGTGEAFRARLGTGNRLLVGTIATLIAQKGLDDLLAVARHCLDEGRQIQFVIVGEGRLRADLERRRRELGLDDTVVITGWVPDAAAQALPAFDVFFQPSRWEAMSIAILEAMAAGKAIVATRVGDNPHVLEDGRDGLLVDAGDIAGMAGALARVEDAGLRQRLGAAAAAKFAARFTVDRMTREYERIYDEVVGR